MNLTVHHLLFTLQAQTLVHLGSQAGAQIRGGLLAALREFANEYVRKGAPLLVSGGRLVQSEWQTDVGEKRTSLELTADAVTLLGSKADAGNEEAGGDTDAFPF